MSLAETIHPPDDIRLVHANIVWLARLRDSLAQSGPGRLASARSVVETMAGLIGDAEVVSDKDREDMARIASMLFPIARALDDVIDNAAWDAEAKEILEDLFCRIEDVAETAALAASKEFAQLIDAEIRGLADGRGREKGCNPAP